MDKDRFLLNITYYAKLKGESVSHACIASGAGKSFISDIKRGQTPSVAKVAALAKHLGVCTSDLVGDLDSLSPGEGRLLDLFSLLSDEGQDKLLDYADDLVSSGKYIKNNPNRVDKEA